MAESINISAINVLKTSIATLEEQVAQMKRATDLLAIAQGLPPVYDVMGDELPTPSSARRELPSADFRLVVGHSFSSDHQD